jgi:1-deoxy-D-xylulose-5-phosphate synthase
VAEKLDATLIDMRFVKPLDEERIVELAKIHALLVTIEENAIEGGAGHGVNACVLAHKLSPRILNLGIPDHFIEHASPEEMLYSCGLTPAQILSTIENEISQNAHEYAR